MREEAPVENKRSNRVEEAPEKLLSVFGDTRIAVWVCVAVAIHVIVIGITSLGYIRDTWIDPEGAAARKAAREAASQGRPATNAAPETARPTQETAPANAQSPADRNIPEEARNTPVVKRITEAAPTNEIPAQPGEIGISIDDTNPR